MSRLWNCALSEGLSWVAPWSNRWSVRHRNMKELRPGSGGRSELRVLFAFDPERRAILLVAGDKAGNWRKWCTVNVPIADDRFTEHLDGLARKGQ